MQELALRLARSPDRDFFPFLFTRIVELSDHCRQHV
jgi:hypothetical protein